MRFSLLASVLSASLALAAFGCAAEAQTDAEEGQSQDELRAAGAASVVKGNTAFATGLYAELKDGDDNVFYSPYSISTALAMTYAGASGSTATAMRQAMHLPTGNVHPAYKTISADLASRGNGVTAADEDRKFQLSIANSLWGEKTQPFKAPFVSTVSANYGAGLELADFRRNAERERGRINAWVEDKTNDKIKELLPPRALTTDTKLVLVNAIYFKAGWSTPFKKDHTEREPFTPLVGAKKNVDMMSAVQEMDHDATADYDAVAMPYVGDKVELVAIAPKTGTFRAFENGLTADKIDGIRSAMTSKRVNLSFPKFKIEGASVKLKAQLTKMGMGLAFADGADFRGITGAPETKIGDVVHKAFISVDEEGTEAAAATAVIMISKSSMPRPAVPATFDRPFVFAIRDIPTGTILFMGRVTKP
jgi:serpin B